MKWITGLLTWSVLLLDCLIHCDIITAGRKNSEVKISNASEQDQDKQILDTVYMTDHCSKLVTGYRHDTGVVYVDSSIIIEATPNLNEKIKTKCKVTFSARDPSERLILHFERMNINYRSQTDDLLRIYDGYDTHSQLTPPHGLYGRYSAHQYQRSSGSIHDYLSSGQAVTLSFVGELSMEFTGFRALLTVFRDANKVGGCPAAYMKCSYSKRCIPEILRCNGFQNCGLDDLSDQINCNQNTPSPGDSSYSRFGGNADFGLMVGCAISIVILLVVVLWLGIVCIKRTKRYRAARRYHNPSVHIPAPHSDVDGAIVEPAAIHHVMAPPISFLEPPPPYSPQQPTAPMLRQLELPPPYSVDERDTAGLLVNESPDGHCPPDHMSSRMVRSSSSTSSTSGRMMAASPSHPQIRVDRVASNTTSPTDITNTESGKKHEDIESGREAVDVSHDTSTTTSSSHLEGVSGVDGTPQITVTPHTPNTATGNFFHLTGMATQEH